MSTERQYSYPQYNYLDNRFFRSALYAGAYITRESNFTGTNVERPLSLRRDRAELYKQVNETANLEEKQKIINDGKDLDRLYLDFSTKQQETTVEMGELGEQISRFVILEPKEKSDDPTIVLIPGVSNDIEGIGDIGIKLATRGRKVVMIAYPESWHGKVTPQFRDAVKESDNFEPHTNFFGQVINKIIGEESLIDLWGISTGSLISVNLLTDSRFNKRINNSVLIVPPGEENQGNFRISLGREFVGSAKNFWKLSQASVCNKTKINFDEEYRKLMFDTHMALRQKVAKPYEWWRKNLISGANKKVLVFIGDKDQLTTPTKKKQEMQKNPTISLASFRQGNHSLSITNSTEILDIAELIQN